jgi:hypothetical protein
MQMFVKQEYTHYNQIKTHAQKKQDFQHRTATVVVIKTSLYKFEKNLK